MLRRASPLPAMGVALAFFVTVFAARCAKPQCSLNSDCGYRRFCDIDNLCRQDCAEDRDCTDGYCDPNGRCISGPPPDAAADASTDAADETSVDVVGDEPVIVRPIDVAPVDVSVPTDTSVPMDVVAPVDVIVSVDNPPPPDLPRDLPPPDMGRVPGAYLDSCTSGADCQSSDCVTSGPAGFCTRRCTSRRDCGDGYLCATGGRCLVDDTGTPCDPRTAAPCSLYCYTTTGSSRAHCTRECSSGRDCPAGYGCQLATGSTSVCVEIERPCNRGSDCATSLCLGPPGSSFRGCSSSCRSAADCPPRMVLLDDGGRPFALPAYSCLVVDSERICVPPIQGVIAGGDVAGSDPIGASCSGPPYLCRSGVCDDTEGPATCVQACNPTGGCPAGYGCKPWLPDGPTGGVYLVCRPAGSGALGSTCTRAADCATALCQSVSSTTGYCTRFCSEGVCPTGMTCTPAGTAVDGTRISLCTR